MIARKQAHSTARSSLACRFRVASSHAARNRCPAAAGPQTPPKKIFGILRRLPRNRARHLCNETTTAAKRLLDVIGVISRTVSSPALNGCSHTLRWAEILSRIPLLVPAALFGSCRCGTEAASGRLSNAADRTSSGQDGKTHLERILGDAFDRLHRSVIHAMPPACPVVLHARSCGGRRKAPTS